MSSLAPAGLELSKVGRTFVKFWISITYLTRLAVVAGEPYISLALETLNMLSKQ